MSDHYEDFYDDREGIPCPRCQGDGTVECYCGGDFCVCENYGERDCPTCYGEGEVTEEREAQYLKAQAEMHEAFRAAVNKADEEARLSKGAKNGEGER